MTTTVATPSLEPTIDDVDGLSALPGQLKVPVVYDNPLYGQDADTLFVRLVALLCPGLLELSQKTHPMVHTLLKNEGDELRLSLPVELYLESCGNRIKGNVHDLNTFYWKILQYDWQGLRHFPEINIALENRLSDLKIDDYYLFERLMGREAILCNRIRLFKRVEVPGYIIQSGFGGLLTTSPRKLWTVCVEYLNDRGEKRYAVLQNLTRKDCELIESFKEQDVLLGLDSEGGLDNVMILPISRIQQYLDEALVVWIVRDREDHLYLPTIESRPLTFGDQVSGIEPDSEQGLNSQ